MVAHPVVSFAVRRRAAGILWVAQLCAAIKERSMPDSLSSLLLPQRAAIAARAIRRVQATVPSYAALPLAELERRAYGMLDPLLADLDLEQPHNYVAHCYRVGQARVQQGLALDDVYAALDAINAELVAELRTQLSADLPRLVDVLERHHQLAIRGVQAISRGFEDDRSAVISSQRESLEQLSTPILPMYEGVLVVPLIGTINLGRAQSILEAVLDGIGTLQADIVILDITGVPIVDTQVARYILQTTQAAQLLGAQVILTGIGPTIAQTMVQLGLDFQSLITRANLQAGLETALTARGVLIQHRDAGRLG